MKKMKKLKLKKVDFSNFKKEICFKIKHLKIRFFKSNDVRGNNSRRRPSWEKEYSSMDEKRKRYNRSFALSTSKKRKINRKGLTVVIIFFVCLGFFTFSVGSLITQKIDDKEIKEQTIKLLDISKIEDIKDSSKTKIVKSSNDIGKGDPYWDFIKMPLINVDFDELKKTNNDTIGWIKVNGTNINYPFVQTNDNDFYLNHDFNKKRNGGGWLFMDYRNKGNDKNTIIYGHGMYNGTLLGTLRNIVDNDWYTNSDNYVVKLSTPDGNTLWQVFSVYKIKPVTDYLEVDFYDDKEFGKFSKMLLKRSIFDFKTSVSSSDRILTLSTCYDKKTRVVLHAKLIKEEKR